jgi:acyl-CoA thioesterase I
MDPLRRITSMTAWQGNRTAAKTASLEDRLEFLMELPMRILSPLLGALLLTTLFQVVAADAATYNIVALGASQTAGRGNGRHSGGVSPDQAFPAQLENMLRARGYDAHVTNAGIAGDTTDGMLSRLDSSVPAGTRLVILQPGTNDGKHRGSSAGAAFNIPKIIQNLRARGIKVIMAHIGRAVTPADIGPDGQHLTAHGQALVAAQLLPRVIAAVGRR